MDIAATKLELIGKLMSVVAEKTLDRIASFLKKEVPAVSEDDFIAEELEELDRRRADRVSGKSKGVSMEEALTKLRSAQRKDEAA